jgi:hypothetical protein
MEGGMRAASMVSINAGYLLLVPVALSVMFLLWVLWNFHQDEKRKPH